MLNFHAHVGGGGEGGAVRIVEGKQGNVYCKSFLHHILRSMAFFALTKTAAVSRQMCRVTKSFLSPHRFLTLLSKVSRA